MLEAINMKRILYIVSGFLALVFGLNFIVHAKKTDFHKNLEKHMTVSVKDKNVQPLCGGKCPKVP